MRGRRVAAFLTVLVVLGLTVPSLVIPIQRGALTGLFAPDLGAAVSFGVVGAFLLARGGTLNIAVIMCVQGIGAATTTFTGVVRDAAVARGPLHGAALWAAWVNGWVWLIGVSLLVPLVLLFPDGRLWRRGWRVPVVLVTVLATTNAAFAVLTVPGLVEGRPVAFAPNPTAFVDLSGPGLDLAGSLGFLGLLALVAVSLGALVARRRRATGVQRAQLTSVLYGGALSVVVVTAIEPMGTSLPAFVLGLFGLLPLATSIAVAVLRYRLYEIDRVVSRTVAYALVLVVLGGVYVGVLSGLAALVPAAYGQVGVAGATLAVAALAVPLTRRVRHVVDRRFHRGRFDAERVVAGFAARLRDRPDRGDVAGDLVAVLQRTVQPSHASVWTVPR